MRKNMWLFVIVCLIMSVLPLNVSATENNLSERTALLARACETFPEYSDKILGSASQSPDAYTYSSGENLPIVNATRNISEDEVMTYTEYADGTILLSDYQFNKTVTYVDQTSSSIVTIYTINVSATCTGPFPCDGYFKASNVKYTIVSGQNDAITSQGTTTVTGRCAIHNTTYVPNETASAPAVLEYRLQWNIGDVGAGRFLISSLKLTVRNNVATVTHVGT